MSTIALLDGYNLLYRLFYAVPPFTAPDGTPVNAVYGLVRLLLGLASDEKPDYLFLTFDTRSKARSELYSEYKATRDRMPDALRIQETVVAELLDAMGIRPLRIEGYEADDIIGTLVRRYDTPENRLWILSGDKDLLQFVSDRVIVYDAGKKQVLGPSHTREKFGVESSQIVDYLAIVGDTSDNIPGIVGFGPKKAQELLGKYESLDGIYGHLADFTPKVRETLEQYHNQAILSRTLATIDTNVPLADIHLEDYRFAGRDLRTSIVLDCFRKYAFRSLLPHEETRGFDTLGITIETIDSEDRLQTLQASLADMMFSLATVSEGWRLRGIVIFMGDTQAWYIPETISGLRDFCEWLLGLDGQIIGFDLKEDLRLIGCFLHTSLQKSEIPSQGILW